MKNEVHLKSAHHTGRQSHYFSQKLSNGHTQKPRWKATVCFHSHLSQTIFTNVVQPILPSTAFNQRIKIVPTLPYVPYERPYWKKTLFSFIIKDIGADFVFRNIKASPIPLLLFTCSQINRPPFTKCWTDDSCCISLQLRRHNSIMSPT